MWALINLIVILSIFFIFGYKNLADRIYIKRSKYNCYFCEVSVESSNICLSCKRNFKLIKLLNKYKYYKIVIERFIISAKFDKILIILFAIIIPISIIVIIISNIFSLPNSFTNFFSFNSDKSFFLKFNLIDVFLSIYLILLILKYRIVSKKNKLD